MVLRFRSLLLLSSSVLMSCVHADVQPRGAVPAVLARTIAHAHADYEESFQLPDGSLTEQASLERMDGQGVCFSVVLRSFSAIDLRDTELALRKDGQAGIAPSAIIATAPTERTYDGVVYRKHKTGSKVACVAGHRDDGTCPAYGAVPTYASRPERGDVTIHESRGEVCFPEAASAAARDVALEVRIRLDEGAHRTQPAGITGGAFRKQVFRWGAMRPTIES